MKHFVCAVFVIAAFACFSETANGQMAIVDDHAILFKITGKGLAKPSYLFGTFHILCPADMMPMSKLDPYIDQADQLVMEIDMDDPAEMQSITAAARLSGGKSWKNELTPEQFARVDDTFKKLVGTPADLLTGLQPTLLSILMLTSPKLLGCAPPSSYDLSLVQAAATKKKPINGLETAAFQGKALEAKPLDQQAKELYETAKDPQKAEDDLKKLIEAYKSQDLEKLNQIADEQEKNDPAYITQLLDDRNKTWIPKLETFIKDKPSFIAVGAGHLAGKNGVINLLRAAGYQVTAVKL